MASGFREPMPRQPSSPCCSSNSNNNSDAVNFECNICFDLAQDPIVTLCGHLYCWPCLYKWLHIHSHSQECPVCKALIVEEKLVPLYGRGKNSTDPRSKSIPAVEIPQRPTGQRPATAPPPDPNANTFAQQEYGFTGGFGPFGNFTLSAAFGGLIPSFFNIQVHGFPDAGIYGPGPGFHHGYYNAINGGYGQGFNQRGNGQQQADSTLKFLLIAIGFSVLMTLIWS
ncbi:hypothetical protein ACJIZ3_002610 [Penstemon smallii]|uniref:E3 ubiquitin-protein ligase RMA n=1 Tax=Penstemon smallii TaxID=265156 RepID=A0ABD3U6X1_9LAMI